MSAPKFIDLLEKNGMLDRSTLAELRKQVAENQHKVTAASIAKALVDKGHLTKFQATKLVGQVTTEEERRAAKQQKQKKQQKKKEPSRNEDLGLAQDDDLGLAPDEGEASSRSDEEIVLLEDAGGAVEEVVGLTPVEDAAGELTPVGHVQPAAAPTPAPVMAPLADASGLEPLTDLAGGGHAASDPFSGQAAAAPQQHAGFAMPQPVRRQRWDTKLMLGGFGVLALLIIFGVVIYINLTATPAVEMWDAAMEDYRSESYSQAMVKFEKFLAKYPEDANSSEARVRIVLCKIRSVLGTPEKGLERSKELLPTVETEKGFATARSELATMLIKIPQEFIKKAKLSPDMKAKEELATLAEAGLNDLVKQPKYVPTSSRNAIDQDIRDIEEDIVRVRRDVNQDKDLRSAIAKIDELLGNRDTVGAYSEFKNLTSTYPGLTRDADLIAAVLKITETEGALVEVKNEPLAPVTGAEAAGPSQTRIVLATRTGDGSSRVQGQIAVVLAGGSVYAVAADTGKVLWDRVVGHGTRFHPIRISKQPDADVLLVDGEDLVRVKAATGDVVWRLPAGSAIGVPELAGGKVIVPCQSGRVLEVDVETGAAARYCVIPQPCAAGPAIDGSRPLIFQPGEHSNVYGLSSETLECNDVYYIGHKAGSVSVPPVVLLGHVFVAENAGSDFSYLHVMTLNAEESKGRMVKAQEPIRLTGNVVVPLVIYGNRLMVVTDRADVRVFDINVNAKENPVEPAATKPASPDSPAMVYPLADAGTLWLADNRLSKFRVQVTTKEINLVEPLNAGDDFIAPLQLHTDVLVYARRMRGSVGVTIAASNIDQPRATLWETQVGVPAGRVMVDASKNEIMVISAAAALFEINKDAVQNKYNDQPTMKVATTGPLSFTNPIDFANGRAAFFNPANHGQLLVYDPAQTRERLRIVNTDLGGATVTCIPTGLAGGVLMPLDRGEIRLVNPADGSNQVLPFQPRLEPGEKIRWIGPDTVGDDDREFVIANDRREMYRIGVRDTPQPHLAEIKKTPLEIDIALQLAVVGDTIYGVVQGTAGDAVVALGVADMKVAKEFDLAGARVTWGPVRVGDAVLVVTDQNRIRCFEAGQNQRWEQPAMAYGKPAGLPLREGSDLIFASLDGVLWRVSAASGQEVAKVDLAEPLGAGPVAYGGRLLLCGNDGALHVVPMLAAGQ